MNWFNQHAPEIQTAAAIAQALSAGVIVCLTIWLAHSTNTYAGLTRESLDLSKKQFDREWLPYWHLSLVQDTLDMANETHLRVANLSRNSARVTHLFIRAESEPRSLKQWDFDLPLAGLEKESTYVTRYLLETIQPRVTGGPWRGVVVVAIGFVVAGTDEPRPSSWFPFKITVQDGKVIEVKPKVPYIAVDLSK